MSTGRSKLKMAAVVSGLVLGATPLATVSEAHNFSTGSSISIGGNFSGQVGSSRAKCLQNRAVKLFKVGVGVVANDSTNDDGTWSINRPNANGQFYVKVLRRTTGRYGHSHTCGGARSGTLSR